MLNLAVVISVVLLSGLTSQVLAAGFDLRVSHPQCTPLVKNQGQCGNDELFSASDALAISFCLSAGANNVSKVGPALIELSTSYVAACMGEGCNGGTFGSAIKDLVLNGSLPASCVSPGSTTCPDRQLEQKCIGEKHGSLCCTNERNPRLFSAKHASSLPKFGGSSAAAWEAAVQKFGGLVAAADKGSSAFQFYSGGILKCGSGHLPEDGTLLIIGYGEEAGQKFWIVQNSWGSAWGEHGYAKVADGECGLGTDIGPVALTPSPIYTCDAVCRNDQECGGGNGPCGVCKNGYCGSAVNPPVLN